MSKGIRGKSEERILSFEILRLLGALLVITQHVFSPYIQDLAFAATTSTFDIREMVSFICNLAGVPIFLFVSGVFLWTRNYSGQRYSSFFIKQIKKVGIPYLLWSCLYFLLPNSAVTEPITISLFFQDLITGGSRYHLWFVPPFITLTLASPFASRVLNKKPLAKTIAIIFACTVAGFFVSSAFSDAYGILLSKVIFFIPFFLCGALYARYREKVLKLRYLIAPGVIMVVLGILCSIKSESLTGILSYGTVLLGSLITVLGLVFVTEYLAQKAENRNFFSSQIRKLSGVTYGVYLAHPLVIMVFRPLFLKVGIPLYGPLVWADLLLLLVVTIVVFAASLLFQRIRWSMKRMLVGRV